MGGKRKRLNFCLENLGSGDQWSDCRWKGKTLEMQIPAASTFPENRVSSTSGMVCEMEWGPAFFLRDSQSSFCLMTFISHKQWENIHAVLVIGTQGPHLILRLHMGMEVRGGTSMRFWTIKVVSSPGIQIFQQGMCPSLFSKSTRNWEPNIQICEPGWGSIFIQVIELLFSFLFLWGKKKKAEALLVQSKGIAVPGSFLCGKHHPRPCEPSASAP